LKCRIRVRRYCEISFRNEFKTSSNAQILRCEFLRNAHILKCMLRFLRNPRPVFGRDLRFSIHF
jgi:hypothetical protein